MRTGKLSTQTSRAPSLTEPSTIHVSHQIEIREMNRVSHPAPFTPSPSITFASNAPSASAEILRAIHKQRIVDLVHVIFVVNQLVESARVSSRSSPATRCA